MRKIGRNLLAFWKRRTRKGSRWCLFVWGWALLYVPLSFWNIVTSEDQIVRGLYGFTLLTMGWMIGSHRSLHMWKQSSAGWRWLVYKQRRMIDRSLFTLDAHRAEHRNGWWTLTPQGAIEGEKEH